MRSKKVIILIGMLLSVSLFATACGQSVEEKIGNKISEKIIEQATDGEVDVDTKDGLSIETEDGSVKAGENLKWPKESMGALPKPKATIISISEIKEEDSTSIILEFDKDNGGAEYMDQIIDLGYIETMLNRSDDYIMYLGVKDDNTSIGYTYYEDERQGTIMIYRDNDGAKEYFEVKEDKENNEKPLEIDASESMDWPKDSMGNIPPLKAQISGISTKEDHISVEFKNIGRDGILSYIEEIKKLGFDENITELKMEDQISYTALDNKNHTIMINWYGNEGNMVYK